jgi:hypothetical protein
MVWILLLLTHCIFCDGHDVNQTNASKSLDLHVSAVDRAYETLINELAAANNGDSWQTFRQLFDIHEAVRNDLQAYHKTDVMDLVNAALPIIAGTLITAFTGAAIAGISSNCT